MVVRLDMVVVYSGGGQDDVLAAGVSKSMRLVGRFLLDHTVSGCRLWSVAGSQPEPQMLQLKV